MLQSLNKLKITISKQEKQDKRVNFMTVYKNVLGRPARLIQAAPLMLHVWPLLHQAKVIQMQNVMTMVMSLKMMKVAIVWREQRMEIKE